jgi:cyanophycinase
LPDTAQKYMDLFHEFGVGEVCNLPFESRADCRRRDWLDTLSQVDGIFMTGGNQLRLSTTIGGTEVAEIIRQRNRNESLHVAGTSAGAGIMAEHMIAYGDEGSTPRSDMVTLVPGLGLTHSVIIDQHFRQRDRLGRLLTALAYNPRPMGIGLDEDTAAIIGPDRCVEVLGSGAITVVDPSDMDFSSMDSANRHAPVCLINIRLHVLVQGGHYNLKTGEALPAEALSRS